MNGPFVSKQDQEKPYSLKSQLYVDANLLTTNAKTVNVGSKRLAACFTVRVKDLVLIRIDYFDMTIHDLRRYIMIDENIIIYFQVQMNSLFVGIRFYFGCVREE